MQSKTNQGALAGIKVVDLSRVLGGPICTQMLADHGAEVIKVEPPKGDETRPWGPPFQGGESSYYQGINRNKRGIALDLSKPAGREIVLRMLADADVLVENFKTGTLERWGIGYDVLSEKFPRLIHCRVSGFGADGPLGGYPGYDAILQAMGGLMSVNGEPDSGTTRIGIPLVDLGTGTNAMIGVLLALFARQQTGKGQFVEAALYDTAIGLMHPHAANCLMSGKVPQLTGSAHPNVFPYDKFQTATGEIFLGIGNTGQFRKLFDYLGKPEIGHDERYQTNAGRGENKAELTKILGELLSRTDGKVLCEKLLAEGIPASAIQNTAEVLAHPHTRHRDMVVKLGDDYQGTGVPVKLSDTPGSAYRKPPTFGQHNYEVLLEYGYDEAEIKTLIAQNILCETIG